jgi:CRISPR-associated protein Cmr6
MVQLVRQSAAPAVRDARNSHAGLLVTSGWLRHEAAQAGGEPAPKDRHVALICATQASELYRLAYRRWEKATSEPARFRGWYGKLAQRMMIGLSTGGALETGVTTHHTYGMPMIPGSSVKGVAQAHALRLGVSAAYRAVLFGEDEATATAGGRAAGAGSLVWHDAWWCPGQEGELPFVAEVVTVHHKEYYAGTGQASDFDSPVPNAQIAVQGGFYFVVEGDPAWSELALQLLRGAVSEAGIGAKRAAGYGFMVDDVQANRRHERAVAECSEAAMNPAERVRARLRSLDEEQLAKQFGPDLNKTLTQYSEEEQLLIPAIALELHGAWIAGWEVETRKTNKARFKARRYFLNMKEG